MQNAEPNPLSVYTVPRKDMHVGEKTLLIENDSGVTQALD
jgi:hypothetical protein